MTDAPALGFAIFLYASVAFAVAVTHAAAGTDRPVMDVLAFAVFWPILVIIHAAKLILKDTRHD